MTTVQQVYEVMQRLAPPELQSTGITPACWWTAAAMCAGCW